VQPIANDLGDGSVIREHNVGHAHKVGVEKRTEHAWFERFRQCREAGDVCEQRCDVTAHARRCLSNIEHPHNPNRRAARPVFQVVSFVVLLMLVADSTHWFNKVTGLTSFVAWPL
jgi:hypothetical protein